MMQKIAAFLRGSFVISVLSGAVCFGQFTNPTFDQIPPVAGAGHDYIRFLNETVSPASGAVNIRVCVPMPPGRNLSLPFCFSYDSNSAHYGSAYYTSNTSYLAGAGWSYMLPTLTESMQSAPFPDNTGACVWWTNFLFQDMQGTIHALGLVTPPTNPNSGCSMPGITRYVTAGDATVNATTPSTNPTTGAPPPVTITTNDGLVYYFPNSAGSAANGTGPPAWIEDRNGNKIVFSDQGNGALTITDTLQRPVLQTNGFGATGNTVTVSGLANPYTVTWASQPFSWTFNFQKYYFSPTNLNPQPLCYIGPSQGPPYTASGTASEITRITLPNGQFYQFQYDPQSGLLSKIIYPDGGYIRYVWANNPLANSQTSASINYSGLDGCEAVYDSPAVQSRFVSFDGTTEVQEQDFSYSTNWVNVSGTSGTFKQWSAKSTTVITKDIAHSLNFTTAYNYTPLQVAQYPNYPVQAQTDTGVYPVNPAETSILSYDLAPSGSTGALLKTITKTYADYWAPPTDEKDTLENGQTSEVKNAYLNAQFGGDILTDQWTYDYGASTGSASNPGSPGALLRHAHADYNGFSTPIGGAIIDRPSDVITYDGSNNEVAETDYCYDGATPFTGCAGSSLAAASATGHDDTNYGPNGPGGGYNRGNVTSKVVKCFMGSTTTACAQGGTIVTNYKFDQTGQVVSRTDPNGNSTTYSYADKFDVVPPAGTNGYLTQIIDALNHTESFQYAYSDGQLIQTTGQNGEQTSYHYADSLRRLTETDFPRGGGQTLLTYNDTPYPPTVVTQRQLDTNRYVKSTAVMDGQGHVTETQLNSDVPGIKTDTTYDYLGRAVTATNPYRSTADSTYGSTTATYDGLGRVTKATKQDGSVVTTQYNGNRTTVTDEIGNQRRTTVDALGRLIRVDEPGDSYVSSPALATLTVSGAILSQSGVGSSPPTYGAGWVTMQGSDAYSQTYGWDAGYIQFQANGCSAKTAYSQTSTLSGLATGLANAINSTPSCQVSANANGNTVNLTSAVAGTAGNFAFTASSVSGVPGNMHSFPPLVSGPALTGGQNGNPGTTVYDSGTMTVTIGSWTSAGIPYGQNSNSTPLQVASALVFVLSSSDSPVTAVVWGADISLVDKTTGAAANGTPVTIHSSSTNPSLFPNGSFSGSAALSGGGAAASSSLNIPFVTLYKYDALGNLLCVEQHGDATSGTGCSSYPNVTASDPWHTRMFTYNSLSELLTAYNPETGTISYAYDKNGNVANKTVPQPNQLSGSTATTTFSYCYDALNRLQARGSANSPNAPLACPVQNPIYWMMFALYDQGTNGIGHRTSMSDIYTSTTWTYDAMGRLATMQRSVYSPAGPNVNGTISYGYNLLNGISSIAYPSGTTVTYAQDNAGRDQSATDQNNIHYIQNATYTPDGKIASFTSSGTITEAYAYNPRLQICREVASTTGIVPASCAVPGSGSAGNILDFNYDFHLGNGATGSDNGNLYKATNNKDTSRSQNYTYDTLNRLLTAQTSGTDCSARLPGSSSQTEYWGESFNYDAWGNLAAKNATLCNAENTPLVADVHNRLSAYGYDVAGNMISNGGISYSYDVESQLGYSAGYHYGYDGDGNRIEKYSGSTGTIYWYGETGILTETDLLGNPQSDYIFFDGARVARHDLTGTKPVYYYFANQIRSIAIVADASGHVQDDSDYYPWGGLLPYSSNVANHYWFTGKIRDESGLDYFGARYYGNTIGRFLTPDWSAKAVGVPYADYTDPQSLNLYGYVRDNPITRTDPDGHVAPRGCSANNSNMCQASQTPLKDAAKYYGNALLGAGKEIVNAITSTVNGINSLAGAASGGGGGEVVNIPQLQPSNDTQKLAMQGTGIAVTAVAVGTVGIKGGNATVSTEEALQGAANRAQATVGPGTGSVYGTHVHTAFEAEVNGLGNSNLSTEVSYKGGIEVPRGTAGSIRPDVVEGPTGSPSMIYDLKTGSATLTPGRISQIQSNVPGGSSVPVKEIKPQ